MNHCRCEKCCPADPAPTYTAGFKLECLAREVANLPTLEDRRAWLADFGARHGLAAVERLRVLVRQVWREREAKSA